MSYNVLIFVAEHKPDSSILLTVSDRLKEVFGYYTRTVSGNFYVVVSRKKDVAMVTAFCYGMRELFMIIKDKQA